MKRVTPLTPLPGNADRRPETGWPGSGRPFTGLGNPALRKNISLLGAFCLFLSAIEYMIPKPLPFMRIGIANLPLMLALDLFPFHCFMLLAAIKALGQALITGTLFSYIFLFSAAGTGLSAVVMYALRRVFGKRVSFTGIGTAGAMVSNVSQLALARLFIFQDSVRFIAPPFLCAGLVTGIALGVFCQVFARRSTWYADALKGAANIAGNDAAGNTVNAAVCDIADNMEKNPPLPSGTGKSCFLSAQTLFALGLIAMLVVLFYPGTTIRAALFLVFWVLALVFKKRTKPLFTVLVILGIVFFNLLMPYGQVLFSVGAFKITGGALKRGIHRAVTLEALVMLSRLTIRPDLKIPGLFGELLSQTFGYFAAIMSRKERITGKNIIETIDSLLNETGDSRE